MRKRDPQRFVGFFFLFLVFSSLFFFGFCDGLCRFWLCCCCCGLIRSWFVFVFLFCAVRLSGRVSGTVLVASETIEDHRLLAAGSRAENQFSLASKNWHSLCVTDSEAIAKFGRELAREDNILDIISFAIPDLCMLLSNFVLI